MESISAFIGACLGGFLYQFFTKKEIKKIPLLTTQELIDLPDLPPEVYVEKKKRINAEENALRRQREHDEFRTTRRTESGHR